MRQLGKEAGDEAYGGNPGLREWLEKEKIPVRARDRVQRDDRHRGGREAGGRAGRPSCLRPGGSG